MDNGTFTIGTLARRAEVGVQTVRYYERIGLLPPPRRAEGGYRRYADDAVARLQFVRHAIRLGFTLAETKELLALRARQGAPCGVVRKRAEEKLAAIDQRLSELRDLRDAVRRLVRTCAGDTAVEHCSILAALGEPEITHRKKSSCPLLPRHPVRPPASPASRRAKLASKPA